MKTYLTLAIVMTILTLTPALQAQSCSTPISNWTGNYTLTGNYSGVTCPAGGNGTCNINEQAAANVFKIGPSVECTKLVWENNPDVITSTMLNDMANIPCPPLSNEIDTFVGTGGAASPSILTVKLSNSTYTFEPSPTENWSATETGCNGPKSWSGTNGPLFPINESPTSSPLPTTVQTLTGTTPLTGSDGYVGAVGPWTLSFTLKPKYIWPKNCPVPWIVSSTIGCENQSLGEDVPIVGTGFNLHYESDRALGAGGLAGTDPAIFLGGWTLSVQQAYDHASNTLFLGDGTQRNGYQVGTPVSFNGNFLITSEDGSEVYVFARTALDTAQHLQTLRPLTGALEYQFGYDAAGNLVTVTDATGNVTTIQRNASEQPTAIVSPYGQTTTLSVDSNGFLSQVTDPLGNSSTFVNTSTGLLTSRTDPNGNIFNYTYDSNGSLIEDADPLGGHVTASSTDANSGFGQTVTLTTAMGRTASYQSTFTSPWAQTSTSTVSEQHTDTWPDGLQATGSESLQSGQLSDSVALPDGTTDSTTLGPDPVWGIQVPIDTSETLTLGNLTMNISGSRSTTLGTAGNPFTVSTETDTQTINGRTYTSTFTGSNLTYVDTTPVGRTVTTTLDSLERVVSTQIEGLTVTDFSYDSRGRLASATRGTRKTAYSYNNNGFLASVTDPLKLTTSFAYDADGHLLTTTLPDGRAVNYSYDANGNPTSITPPGESAHDFSYTAVDLPSTYTPPTVAGTGATTYAYDLDRNLTTVTRPDGETINYGFDDAGRLISIGTPTGTTSYSYNATTGNLATESRGAEHIAYVYNGPLPTKSTWTGTVAGSVSRNYNDNFWVKSQSVGGGSNVAFHYDNDGLLTEAGSFAIKRSSKNGLITGTTLGMATDSRTYDSFGELIGYTASANGAAVYSVKFTRDADGRVTAKTETIGGTTNTYAYTYDPAGRLTSATKNSATDTYTYDTNSNRLSATTSAGTSNCTYDAQDRLLTYGTASYSYTANGELTSQTVGTQKTTYKYDVLGNLTAVTLPSGTKIAYIIDAQNHRVGKEVNGALETGFLYDDDRIVAQLNATNQVISQFVYATGVTSPDYMISGGVTYRIFSDQLGSSVLVVNTSTGTIAEQITYDEFGNVLSDTNPGFQPFGFAGGLYDQDTKLIRFGARDYNPSIGRWTAKDPILFKGGSSNLYGYVLNDPVNMTDSGGLQSSDADLLAPLVPNDADLLAPLVRKHSPQHNKRKKRTKCPPTQRQGIPPRSPSKLQEGD